MPTRLDVGAVACVALLATACSSHSSTAEDAGARDGSGDRPVEIICGPCPDGQGIVIPYFVCDPVSAPVLTLSGPCVNFGGARTPDGVIVPVIGAAGAGTCHATLSLSDAAAYSTDIVFTAHPLAACCGDAFLPEASTWTIDNACEDAGSNDAGADGASSVVLDGD